MPAEWILEVSDLNEYVRAMLNADPALRSVRLRGEISNFKRHSSGEAAGADRFLRGLRL